MKNFYIPGFLQCSDVDFLSIMSNESRDVESESYPDFSWLVKILDNTSTSDEEVTDRSTTSNQSSSNDLSNSIIEDISTLEEDLSSLEADFSNPTNFFCDERKRTQMQTEDAATNNANLTGFAGQTLLGNSAAIESSQLCDGSLRHQDTKSLKPKRNRRKPLEAKKLLVKSLFEWLENPKYNPSAITWILKSEGTFKIIDSVAIARLWGEVKGNKNMTHEKLSRALRHYYTDGTLEREEDGKKKKLCYKFTDAAFRKFNVQKP